MKTFREEALFRIKKRLDEIARELKSRPHSEHKEQRMNGQIEGLKMAIKVLW